MKRYIRFAVMATLGVFFAACNGATPPVQSVEFDMIDSDGNTVGQATLTEVSGGVAVGVQVSGLSPGPRGFHFHENGVCDPPDFESAGGHFNPQQREHGLDNPDGPHAGDLPNLVIGEDGTGDVSFTNEMLTLDATGANSLTGGNGTALVIHAGEDDQVTDPDGDSGDRVVCGVVS